MKPAEILAHNAEQAKKAAEWDKQGVEWEWTFEDDLDGHWYPDPPTWDQAVRLRYYVRTIEDDIRARVAEAVTGKWLDLREYPEDQRQEVIDDLAEVVPHSGSLRVVWSHCAADATETFPLYTGEITPWGRDKVEDMRRHSPITPNEILRIAGRDPIEPRKAEPTARERAVTELVAWVSEWDAEEPETGADAVVDAIIAAVREELDGGDA